LRALKETERTDEMLDDIITSFSKEVGEIPISFATIHKPALLSNNKGVDLDSADAKGKSAALRAIDPPNGLELRDCVIWYLGEEGRSLLNIQMTHAANPVRL